ncbi:MAG: winged helix-turn-helix domain-containing protein [Candidatus Methanofastidiosia archaeon]
MVRRAYMSRYRSTNRIIQRILECIFKKSLSQSQVLKTHIIQYANLKTPMAERYLDMLRKAGYITEHEGMWGDRKVIYYALTDLGRTRYSWFQKINAELYEEE